MCATKPEHGLDGARRWRQLVAEAPELAAAIQSRFESHPHHVVATIRADGGPRASGTNVMFVEGDLFIGCMDGAHKGADLRRDPRYSLHSAPLDEHLHAGTGDAKLAGYAQMLDSDQRAEWCEATERVTGDRPEEEGEIFRLTVREASIVEVDGDELAISLWTPAEGVRSLRRR